MRREKIQIIEIRNKKGDRTTSRKSKETSGTT
jgi:hypothetical protein